MPQAPVQDRLPLNDGSPAQVTREARAEAMASAGIRPPQRYEVTAADHFEPIRPRSRPWKLLLRLVRRLRH